MHVFSRVRAGDQTVSPNSYHQLYTTRRSRAALGFFPPCDKILKLSTRGNGHNNKTNMRKRIGIALAALASAYMLLIAGALALMFQPPASFARAMGRVPGPLFAVLPFQTLWTFARAGNLRVGDPAPDFQLQRLDRQGSVRLSSFRGQKPVVLVFGSYT